MPFYKKDQEQLLVASESVSGPHYDLHKDTRETHTYPVDGWYWFDTLDDAMTAFARKSETAEVSPRQIRQAMGRVPYGNETLRDVVEAAVESGDRDLKDWWLYSTTFERDNPQVIGMANALGVSAQQLDELWALASSL